jgi:hypothetical protein
MDADEPIYAIADALGPDVIELAPADEDHFDASSAALMAASAVAGAVGSGILGSIRQAAQDSTTALLRKAGWEIGRRITRKHLQPIFDSDIGQEAEIAALDAAASQLRAAAGAIKELDAARRDQLVQISAAAVGEALMRLGLNDATANRVQQTVQVQIQITLDEV